MYRPKLSSVYVELYSPLNILYLKIRRLDDLAGAIYSNADCAAILVADWRHLR